VLGSLVLERGLHVWIQLHWPQVDVLIKGEAGLEQDAHFQDAGLDVRVADGAQENGIELLEFLDRTVGQDLAG
jgi:predicted Fe-Mo cluster-binding NifX family protein